MLCTHECACENEHFFVYVPSGGRVLGLERNQVVGFLLIRMIGGE